MVNKIKIYKDFKIKKSHKNSIILIGNFIVEAIHRIKINYFLFVFALIIS